MTAVLELPGAAVADEQGTSVCAAGGRPHPVVDGNDRPMSGHLCARHHTVLERVLRDIEREAGPYQVAESGKRIINLDPTPSMQTLWDRSGGALASEQSPVRTSVVVHRDTRHGDGNSEDDEDLHAGGGTWPVLVVLNRWADHIRRERPLTVPTVTVRLGWERARRSPVCAQPCGHDSCGRWITDTVRAEPTLTSELAVLTRQLDWAADQDWVGDMYTDLRQLRDQLRRINGTHPPDPLPGRCPNMVNGAECGGPLWPVKPKHTSGEDVWTGASPSAVRCSACTQRWEGPSDLARLALILERQSKAKGHQK